MKHTVTILMDSGDIVVAKCDIDEYSDRRERHTGEKNAVDTILQHLFGEKITIGHYPNGAPYIESRPNLNISISHSSMQAVVAIARNGITIGVDTETMRHDQLRRVVDRYMSPSEKNIWGGTPRDMLLAWCIKEAAYKAAGHDGINFVHGITISQGGRVTVCGQPFCYKTVEISDTHATVIVTDSQK
ncbi:MAG: 4'-phosphopantetheinyl transferase superfamily protein [Clostridiales bacterium]|nr:4'-phosphopantetheinyl transferase superfamily protein [Clostridiales bacterium]